MSETTQNKYLALTIGPIIPTLLAARKTRELWGASYLFSYLMRKTVEAVIGDQEEYKIAGKVLLPATEEIEENTKDIHGAGLYPDRIIIEVGAEEDVAKLGNAFDSILEDLAMQMFHYQRHGNPFKGGYLPYLREYINLSYVLFEVEKGKNIVYEATSFLETAELQTRIRNKELIKTHQIKSKNSKNGKTTSQQVTPLSLLLNKVNGSPLFEDGFQNTKERFDSLIEIATRELVNIPVEEGDKNYKKIIEEEVESIDNDADSEKTEENVVRELKKAFPDSFKAHHKYIAIVHADGDNIGKVVEAVGEDAAKLKEFSKVLISFAKEATGIVAADYGGAPIYMGGDDMLFIAPVATRSNKDESKKTIFQLVEDLDKLFEKRIKNEYRETVEEAAKRKGKNPEFPSLSFGISITYYKYPLYEAKNMSYNLLEHVKHKEDGKNAVNVMFQKHSGQQVPFILHKHKDRGDIYAAFLELVQKNVNNTNFLNSFTCKLEAKKTILTRIAADKNRLEHFFKNNWNENYKSNKAFFEAITDFIFAMRKNRELQQEDFQLLYATLRFIHFILSDDKN